MALFYQIDFTVERHARIRTWLWVALALVLCLLAGLGLWAQSLYEEWKRPDAHSRLQQVHLLAERMAEGLDCWRRTADLYVEVSPYVAQKDELPPALMLGKLDGLADLGVVSNPDPNGYKFQFLPKQLEVRRAGTLTLSGSSPFPAYEKAAHRAALAECLSNVVIRTELRQDATNVWRHATDVRATCTLAWQDDWEKAAPDGTLIEATLVVNFEVPQAPAFPPPPPELTAAVHALDGWRKTVRAVKLKVGAGRIESVETLMLQLVADNRSALGEQYDRVERLSRSALDPLAVPTEIRKALRGVGTSNMIAFEEAWKAHAQRRLRRDATIDNPGLDALLAECEYWSGQIPRRQDLEASQAKAQEYLDAMTTTNSVCSTYIKERRFEDVVLKPAVSAGSRFAAFEVGKIDIGGAGGRVAFPEWCVKIGETSTDQKNSHTGMLSRADAEAVLLNIETNSAGMWVTSAVLTFDDNVASPKERWNAIRTLTVTGRVPCRMRDKHQP